MRRTYSGLLLLDTLEERYEYLQLAGVVGDSTFGSERIFNQQFYRSREWRDARSIVRARDLGMDLAIDGLPVRGDPYVHHMNPIRMQDLEEGSDILLDPEYLITCSLRTHNAIHFGNSDQLPARSFVERTPGDTKTW